MTGQGMQRSFRGSECPLGAPHPAGVGWGPVGGHWAGQRLLPKSRLRLAMGIWQDPCLGVFLLFPAPQSLPAPPIPWVSCSSRGDPTPRSCLRAVKRFETTVMAGGNPRQGVLGHPSPPGQDSMAAGRLRASTPGNWEGGGADPVGLSPNPSAGMAVGNIGTAGALPGKGLARSL